MIAPLFPHLVTSLLWLAGLGALAVLIDTGLVAAARLATLRTELHQLEGN